MPRTGAFERGVDVIQEQATLAARIDELTFQQRRAPDTAPAASEVPLVARVLVGVGTGPATLWATGWAEALGPVFAPRVTLAHVDVPVTTYPGAWGEAATLREVDLALAQEKAGLRALDEAAERVRRAGLDVTVRRASGSAVRELALAAREEDADLVVVGSPGRSALDRFLLGSVADGVKDHTDTNVLLAKGEPTPGDVLCAVDGARMSQRAAALALRIARAWGSVLHVVHVIEPPAGAPPASSVAQLDALRTRLELPWDDLPRVEFRLLVGDPAVEIVREADRTSARLLVMGNRGLGGLRSLVAGSVSNYVTHHVPHSVLLVKGPGRERAAGGTPL